MGRELACVYRHRQKGEGMELSQNFIEGFAERFNWMTASEYGEPGYSDGDVRLVVLGNYWCRCDKIDGLHGRETHHPRLWQQLEDQGVRFEWEDEWIVDYDGFAWRTQADSYSWTPSHVILDDGELLTIRDDIEDWIDWAVNDSGRALMGRHHSKSDMLNKGFAQYGERYYHGLHEGMTAQPSVILDEIHENIGAETEVVFRLSENSQFYVEFEAYYRFPEDDD